MTESYIYGPVPSRRLGRSLGIDLVPYKVCSYDCVYCQLGRTSKTTIEKKPYIPAKIILKQLYKKMEEGLCADTITLAGSGEPTLNIEIGSIIRGIKEQTKIPVVVLTNGSLLHDVRVRRSIMEADVILPSLDAHNQTGFEVINRPHPDLGFANMVSGLIDLRKEYPGRIWLETFLVDGINETETDALQLKKWIEMIKPEKIHINTAVRPAAESFARRVSRKQMARFCKVLGEKAEPIASYIDLKETKRATDIKQDLLNLLARRPCTLDDLSSGLNAHKNEILKYIEPLVKNRTINIEKKDSAIYYQASRHLNHE